MIKSNLRVVILLVTVLGILGKVKAQTKTMDSATVTALREINNIALATDAYDNQQFDISIISGDGTTTDTTSGTCSIQGENYRYVFDSVQQIQNQFMNLEIHADGKIFVVSKPVSFSKQLLKGNIDESLFQQMNVNTIAMSSVGGNKKLTFNLLDESMYKAYSITYDPTTYRVVSVYMQTKVADENGDYSSSNFITTNITLQNFISITSGSVSFDTSPYVYLLAGNVIQKQVAYNDYQIIDLLNENN